MTNDDRSTAFAAFVADFARRRVLVLGDVMLDEYVHGECGRISPEAPVPVVQVQRSRRVLGGAANTAANIVALGGAATLIGLVGMDEAGRTLHQAATDAKIDLVPIDHGRPTLRKMRIVSHQQQMMRLDYEDVQPPGAALEAAVYHAVDAHVASCDVVVISDYAKGFLSLALTHAIIERAHQADRPVIVDPRPQHRDFYKGCDYLTPNWKEARALLRASDAEPTASRVTETARTLAATLRCNVVLTLGAHGIAYCSVDGSEEFSQPTMAREVFDVSGAGDTVVAAFALARASQMDHAGAVSLANKAASIVVGKFGTATVTGPELLEEGDRRRIVPRQGLALLAATLRARGRRIVTVNGSFDLLHAGHLHILNEAKRSGDVLIVGINSDASVRAYKGPSRPLVPEQQRAEMLLALRSVDYVHIFEEADPRAFLAEVLPDVHVNGAEYGDDCIERDVVVSGGGRVQLVTRLPGLSTTGLLQAMDKEGA